MRLARAADEAVAPAKHDDVEREHGLPDMTRRLRRIAPQFNGRATPLETRRARAMKRSTRVVAMPCDGPLAHPHRFRSPCELRHTLTGFSGGCG
jgi:hypothetical protein